MLFQNKQLPVKDEKVSHVDGEGDLMDNDEDIDKDDKDHGDDDERKWMRTMDLMKFRKRIIFMMRFKTFWIVMILILIRWILALMINLISSMS
ncbi:unnamed protein product [Orchesella dallaii]|uniref:Uncharacterized protein n=1 Tax=Orchesella dallaii TaxID=48710 RepID=A0ABP1Q9R5_9HEXA